jgi:hypothetical protein
MVRRIFQRLCWLAPPLFLLAVYWRALGCYFVADDFAWLSLWRQIDSPGSLLRTLFEPAAQGTIRPLTDRGAFLLLHELFGFDSLPFHLLTFATMAAAVSVLAWVAWRTTGLRYAGVIAGLVWAGNACLGEVMAWSSAYNEALCALLILLALACFIRFAETGRRRYWWWQAGFFVIGFGALEINVVYPALAGAWACFAAPREKRHSLVRSLIPLGALSVIYFLIHRAVAPLPTSGPYVLHFDARILLTLAMYARWEFLPPQWPNLGFSSRAGYAIMAMLAGGSVLFFAAELRKRKTIVLFFVAWFLIALAPVAALPAQRVYYYLTIPSAGLALFAGYAYACAWRNPRPAAKILAGALILVYLGAQGRAAVKTTRWRYERSIPVRALVLGTEAAHETHPDKTLLIDRLSNNLYRDAVGDGAFYALGVDNVYLTPGSEHGLEEGPDMAPLAHLVVAPEAAAHAMRNELAVVYVVSGDHLRNITRNYLPVALSQFPQGLPTRVDLGNPLYEWILGPGWHPIGASVRAMDLSATLRLRVPDSSGNQLVVEGYFWKAALQAHPPSVSAFADGLLLGKSGVPAGEAPFHLVFDVPESFRGKQSAEVRISVSPEAGTSPQDSGAIFETVEIAPQHRQ